MTTNLIKHIRCIHKDAYAEYESHQPWRPKDEKPCRKLPVKREHFKTSEDSYNFDDEPHFEFVVNNIKSEVDVEQFVIEHPQSSFSPVPTNAPKVEQKDGLVLITCTNGTIVEIENDLINISKPTNEKIIIGDDSTTVVTGKNQVFIVGDDIRICPNKR